MVTLIRSFCVFDISGSFNERRTSGSFRAKEGYGQLAGRFTGVDQGAFSLKRSALLGYAIAVRLLVMSSDITFITNEAGQSLRERFAALLGSDTRQIDCLVGYFFISGFYKLFPSLKKVEKVRILVGLDTDRAVYDLMQNRYDTQLTSGAKRNPRQSGCWQKSSHFPPRTSAASSIRI